jgi:hypothetical protein
MKLLNKLLFIIFSLLITSQAMAGYLGLRVQNLPEHIRAHLPDAVANNQGVVVDWVEDISPAADDGVKRYDVLISLDDKPIRSVAQFYQTTQQARAGQKITLKLVRQGEILKVPVTFTEPPRGVKMTPAPRQAALYRPGQNTAPQRKPNFRPNPALPRPLNIVGKPAFPMRKKPEKHAWGDERHIWPDFYTKGTNNMWDDMINAPFKMGRMPGGWRAPSLSMPDPVTIGDAVTNQIPPIMEEAGNMTDFTD